MTHIPRPYQTRTVADVLAAYAEGVRRVCVVAPPGAGKTTIGAEVVCAHPQARTLWLANRIELIDQAAARLRAAGLDVACISPRHAPDPWARVQVASLDTLTARGQRPPADLVVKDECHHAAAETYSAILESYPDARHLGLTATPQRQDGKALDGHYDRLVVAAHYSELLAAGHLVRCRRGGTSEAEGYLGNALAQHPLAAWQAMPEGPRQTFAFAPSVPKAHEWAAEFNAAGIPSACIEGNTNDDERTDMLARFRAGELRVLWNVYVLTEGTDIPSCSCVLLARGVSHVGAYLQITGRALRPHASKTDARLIDLSGAYWLHGSPTADREYALDGRPIRLTGEPLKNCPQCGSCIPAAQNPCPDCGYEWPAVERPKLKIFDLALQWEIEQAGGIEHVSDEAKRREWDRLMALVETREKWSVGFARREYEKLFGEPPPAEWVSGADATVRVRELAKLLRVAAAKKYKPQWAAYRFKHLFHRWPSTAEMVAARGAGG